MSWNYLQTPSKSAYRLSQLSTPPKFSLWKWLLEIFMESGDSRLEYDIVEEDGVLISVLFELIEKQTTIETIDIFTTRSTGEIRSTKPSKIQNFSDREVVKTTLWSDLHNRHKLRILFSASLILLGIVDILLKMLGLNSIGDLYSDILWIIGALGLLGTSVYLALEL